MIFQNRVIIASTTVYETSAVGAMLSLTEVLQKYKIAHHSDLITSQHNDDHNDQAKDKILFLHLGVNTCQQNFCLEKTAWNGPF
jgi:hypothetical protein